MGQGERQVSRELIEILILAAIAGVVVARFYALLGRKTGSQGPSPQSPSAERSGFRRPAPVEAPVRDAALPIPGAAREPLAEAEGLEQLVQADPSFDPSQFLSGARAAYEMIVQAFASGDKDTLRGLLTPKVFERYAAAIDARAETGAAAPELVRLRLAEIASSALGGSLARIGVRFEAELAEGAHGLRETRERWTFERDIRSRDPTWRLSGVAQA